MEFYYILSLLFDSSSLKLESLLLFNCSFLAVFCDFTGYNRDRDTFPVPAVVLLEIIKEISSLLFLTAQFHSKLISTPT